MDGFVISNSLGVVFALVVALILGVDLVQDIRRLATARSVALLSALVWYALEAIVAPHEVRVAGQAAYDQAVVGLSVATASLLFAYHTASVRAFDDLTGRLRLIESPTPIWILFVAGMSIGLFAMAVFVEFRLGAFFEGLGGIQARWSDPFQRGRYGGFRDAILELSMFMRAVVPFGVIVFLSRKFSSTQRVVALLLVSWLLWRAIISGHRSQVLPLVLPIAAAIYWKSGPRLQQKLLIYGVPAAALAAYLFSAVIVQSRNQGEISFDADKQYVGFEMFRELIYIQENVPEPIDYQMGLTYYVQLVNPIPRFLWPGKPSADAGLLLAKAKGMVNESREAFLTNSPGFVGEAYLNFGFWGLIAIPAFAGVLLRAWDRMFIPAQHSFLVFVVYAAGLATIFLSGRSFNMSTFYAVMALYGLLILMQWMGDRRFDPKAIKKLPVVDW